MLALSLLPLSPAVLSAGAGRTADHGLFNNVSVADFEVNITGTATSKNTTLLFPIHKDAHVTNAALNVSGKPELSYVTILGQGNAYDDGEDFGHGIDGADFNNDGYGDLAVGWGGLTQFVVAFGRVEVYYGGPAKIIGGRQNWTNGAGLGDAGYGYSITHGDYNHDGIQDLVVGESYLNFGGSPETVRVFYGSSSGLPDNASVNLTMNSTSQNYFGRALAGHVDINGDGYDDLIVGEQNYNGARGRVDVLWGGPGGLNVTNVTFISANLTNNFGETLKSLGDTDGDGLGEFAVGAPQNGTQFGMAVVFEGVANSTSVVQRWSYTANALAYLGYSIAGGLDITGDGVADLAIGAPFVNSQGVIYVFDGKGNATYSATPDATLPALSGAAENLGIGLDFIRDFDGDGKTDLIAGGNRWSPDPVNNPWDGRFYLYMAQNLDPASAVAVDNTNRAQTDEMGWRTYDVGDLNGDGVDEFTVTVHSGTNGTVSPGLVRLYYGNKHAFPENVTIYVGSSSAWSRAGSLRGNVTASGFGASIQAYITANQALANATGIIMVPLSFNFTNGGKLNVSNILIQYSLVSPPNASVTAPSTGGLLTVSWGLQPTDGNLYSVWSNKTGSWAVLANVSYPRNYFNDTNVTDGVRSFYYVTETDTSVPLQSGPSAIVSATPVDVLPPLVPANFSLTKTPSTHTIRLQWSPNGDDTVRYEVWRRDGDLASFALVANVSVPLSAYSDIGLQEEVNYTYEVRAVDGTGLRSPFTVQLTERLPDVTPPPTPANLNALADASGTSATLTWDLNAFDTAAYAVLRSNTGLPGSFVEVGQAAAGPFSAGGLTRNQTYYFEIQAVDAVLQRSPLSAVVSIRTVDTQAPGAPVLVDVSSLSVGNTVQLNWTAAGDDLALFRIYTNASGSWALSLQASGQARSAMATNLTDGVAAFFRITAVDFGSLEGLQSNTLSATPQDTQRPGAPTGLAVSAPSAGASLSLVWSPPTDNDVAGYRVLFLDPTVGADYHLAGIVTGATTFTHTGLKNGVTYRYQVVAFDEVPNDGAPSVAASGSPKDTIPPSPPRITTPSVTANVVNFAIQGTSEPNMSIEIWVRGNLQSTVAADATGNWTGQAKLIAGDNEIAARAVDPSPIIDTAAKFSQNSATLHIGLDTVKPTASSTSPAAGATGVDTGSSFVITFSKTMNPGTVHIAIRDSSGNDVPGNLTVDVVNHTAKFTPSAPLQAGATYDASVSGSDTAGNAMAPTSVSFTTKSAGGPSAGKGFLPGFEGFLAIAALLGAASLTVAYPSRRRGG
jgi:hypothetical protein